MRRTWISTACVLCALALACAEAASAEPVDPDQAAKVSSDVNISLRTLTSGVYELILQNQSGIGFINTFAWVPGPGWAVTAILGTSRGTCIVNDGALSCSG